MANNKGNKKSENFSKNQEKEEVKTPVDVKEEKGKINKNTIIMKLLIFLGTIIFFIILVYLAYFFFVKNSDIKVNMSTDKKLEYLTFNGKEELIPTQKYVSDLNYSMRYDVDKISVFKYKGQDFFKFNDAEKILVIVEHSQIPSHCAVNTLENDYDSCTVRVDDFTLEHYIKSGKTVFKITIKTPNNAEDDENIQKRIDYMIKSFTINI